MTVGDGHGGTVDQVVTVIVVVTLAVVAAFYLVTLAQPFILWVGVAIASIVYRSIGSLQIMMINNKRLHPDFKVTPLNVGLLWFSFISGLAAVALWFVFVFPGEACKQAGWLCP